MGTRTKVATHLPSYMRMCTLLCSARFRNSQFHILLQSGLCPEAGPLRA